MSHELQQYFPLVNHGATHRQAAPFSTPAESHLVLSLFPGAGLLDKGFEQAGFIVVRGPDTLLGQRIQDFRAERGKFVGVIGGPPCQDFSRARRRPPSGHGLKMLLEYSRIVQEAEPDWFLMENVPQVPDVHLPGYVTQRFNIFASELGLRQKRNRSFQFGSRDGVQLVVIRSQSQPKRLCAAVLAKDSRKNFCGPLRVTRSAALVRSSRLVTHGKVSSRGQRRSCAGCLCGCLCDS